LQHFPGKASQKTIRQACNSILFVDQQWSTQQPGCDSAGTGRKAAHPQDDFRTAASDHAARLDDGPENNKWSDQPGQDAFAAHARDGNPLEGKTSARNQFVFQTARRSKPDHRVAQLAQGAGDSKGRKNMSAGPSSHNQYRTYH
jgi:hypothetical protein